MAIDIILQSLPKPYDGFIMNYNMHGINKIIFELHGMLKTTEKNIKTTKDVLIVNKGKGMRKGKGKNKASKSFQKPKPKPKLALKQNHLRRKYTISVMIQAIGKEIASSIWMI